MKNQQSLWAIFVVLLYLGDPVLGAGPDLPTDKPFALHHAILNLSDRDVFEEPEELPVTILVEEGSLVPSLHLIDLASSSDEVLLFELEGPARFKEPVLRTLLERTATLGRVLTPPFDPGRIHDESVLRISTQNGPVLSPISVVVLPKGWVSLLADFPLIANEALLFHDETVAVADQALVPWERWQEFSPSHGGEKIHSRNRLQIPPDKFDPLPGDEEWCPGGCIRVPFGPGLAIWTASPPIAFGWSVKPEDSLALVHGTPPSQAIDGIYNRSWGCGVTIKVPDSCTATIGSGPGVECCCNHLAALFGKYCKWRDPVAIGWPACPL